MEELEKRLRGRATEEEAAVQSRVEAARQEIARCADLHCVRKWPVARDVELEMRRQLRCGVQGWEESIHEEVSHIGRSLCVEYVLKYS